MPPPLKTRGEGVETRAHMGLSNRASPLVRCLGLMFLRATGKGLRMPLHGTMGVLAAPGTSEPFGIVVGL